ncbi:MAG: hypothetical protein AVDCRST_MAG61-2645 [uncultured Friedmanniella sp.]|uniref:Uncharacterized protein n=1 Tax=uncultured Friedmanniella sp. TaxID=335381 RepID=A0A6J4L5H2_9ACTN|nr:MAG: hypothetical protein AVDCRST_MAG61-2645 [uncultured Friedmanniella sp.]
MTQAPARTRTGPIEQVVELTASPPLVDGAGPRWLFRGG